MTLKDFIKLFVPPVAYKLRDKARGKNSNNVQLQSSPLPQIEHNSDRMILIGNGPSLNKSVELYQKEIISCDRVVANFFASSSYYELLQPNIYVFADPAFFDVPENQKESITALFDSIVKKTTWSLRMFVPYEAREALLLNTLKLNPNIKVDYYFTKNQNVGSMSKFEAWDRNLIGPPRQNVMNVALYLSLFWGYKETYLIGVDMSSLEDIRVDQETNELFSVDTHFYNNKEIYSDKKLFDSKRGRIRSDWKLHEYIYAFGRMFEYFYDLKEYADYKGLKVYNASEYSWINVFERKKLKN
ncbi:MAG: hypothetical protein J6T48_07925 [Bacteroidales bacterium]|nr:hypothetical protein [Bacteroidales bacterium]